METNYVESWLFMYAPGHITRKDENNLPTFFSHDEAREWFQEKYGQDKFQLTDSEIIMGKKCYFYHLILNKDMYWEFFEALKKDGFVSDSDKYLGSYQSVEIFEDGFIHVVH